RQIEDDRMRRDQCVDGVAISGRELPISDAAPVSEDANGAVDVDSPPLSRDELLQSFATSPGCARGSQRRAGGLRALRMVGAGDGVASPAYGAASRGLLDDGHLAGVSVADNVEVRDEDRRLLKKTDTLTECRR